MATESSPQPLPDGRHLFTLPHEDLWIIGGREYCHITLLEPPLSLYSLSPVVLQEPDVTVCAIKAGFQLE